LVDVEVDTRVSVFVGSRESHTARGRVLGARARDGELDASYVWLHTIDVIRIVEGEYLSSEQVVSRRNVRRDGDSNKTLIGDEGICSPLLCRSRVPILVDLEPRAARAIAGLREVELHWSLVGGVEDIIRGIGVVVVPLDTDPGTSCYGTFPVSCLSSVRQETTSHVGRRKQGNGAVERGRWVRAYTITFGESCAIKDNAAKVRVCKGTLYKQCNEPDCEENPRC